MPSLGERYQIVRPLGRGATKRVFLARDTRLDRDVAIAVIETGGLDEAGHARLLRETQAMGQLGDHPSIVTVLDVIERPEQVLLISQFMPGGDLAQHLKGLPDRRLASTDAATMAMQVCAALEHAHSRSLVHRDLKPANIWLTADGEARLGDFGLAYALDRTRLTQDGVMVGTAPYMAPEQALGQPPDRRSDLYALGATLYEMVTGRPPFVGDDAVAIISQHINTPPVTPSLAVPDLHPHLEALILELLAKNPDIRPDDATTVRRQLERIAQGSLATVDTLAAPAARAVANPLDRLASGIFVGREAEVERGRAAFEEVLSGQARWLLVMGEPGIGKTRICEELTTYARLRGGRAFWGRCHEGDGAPPYWPWIQIVRAWTEGRDPETLRRNLGFGATELAEMVSEIRQILPDLPSPPRLDAEQARFRLFDAVVGFLRNAAQEAPLLLVLDDLHWADKPSLLLLEFIARELGPARILVVATYRDVELRRRHPLTESLAELARLGVEERLQLRGIGREHIARFIEQSADLEPPASLVDAIYRETEGNPFFVHEVVRLLVTDGRLSEAEMDATQRSGSWSLEIPQGVREVIGRRLNRLSEECNEILLAAAVIGREFDLQLLQRVADRPAEVVLERIDEALAARVALEVDGTVGRFRFSHALIRETLHEELSTPSRIRLHARAADGLEQAHGDQPGAHLAEVAHHRFQAIQAGDLDRARIALIRAAEWAQRHRAWEEEAEHLERALQVLDLEQDADAHTECELRVSTAEAHGLAADVDHAREHALRATELARDLDEPILFARAAIAFGGSFLVVEMGRVDQPLVDLLEEARKQLAPLDSAEARAMLVRTDSRLATELYFGNERRRIRELMDEASTIAESLSDPALQAIALRARVHEQSIDDVDAMTAAATELIELEERVGSFDFLGFAQAMLARACLFRGDRGELDRCVEAVARLAHESRIPTARIVSAFQVAMTAVLEGRFDHLGEQLDTARAQARSGLDPNIHQWAGSLLYAAGRHLGRLRVTDRSHAFVDRYPDYPVYRAFLCALQVAVGETDEARANFEVLARDRFTTIPRDNNLDGTLVLTAEVCCELGDRERAHQLYELLLAFERGHAQIGPAVTYLGPFDLRLGMLSLLLGEQHRAVGFLRAAVSQTVALRARPFEAESRLWLARALSGANGADSEPVREEAERASAIATALGMAPVATAAAELLV